MRVSDHAPDYTEEQRRSFIDRGLWNDDTVATYVEKWARETPDKLAIVAGGRELTYAEVHRTARRHRMHGRVEEERQGRPSSLIPPDVRISRIRRTEGVSSVGTRRSRDCLAASLIPGSDRGARRECGRVEDGSHVGFDGGGVRAGA